MSHPVWKTSTAALGKAIRLTAIALLALVFGTGAAFAELRAYVTNQNSDTISVIDVATNTVVDTIPVSGGPFTLVITADGSRAYVTLGDNDAVAVVDLATSSVVATVPVGLNPDNLTLSVDEAFLYVVNSGDETVSVIDTATNTVTATVSVGSGPRDIAAAPDGASVWVPQFFNNVSVIDTATQTVTSFGVGSSSLRGLVFTPDGAFVYLGNSFGGGRTLVIDTATRTVVASIPTGSSPFEYAITPDGARVYLTRNVADSVAVIDTATNTLAATVPVGDAPAGIAITPDGAFAYVANFSGNSVSVIDTATNTVVATVPVGTGPTGVAIADVPDAAPPVLTSDNATVTVNEGQTAANTGTVTDANGDTVTLTASVGRVINNGNGTWSWSFRTNDGPVESQTVTITGNDGNGGISSTTFDLVVNNVAPNIIAVINSGPVPAGGSATITVAATDPGDDFPLAHEFDCNNDGVFEIGPQADRSASCTFASAGSYTVNVRVSDGDGGVSTGSTVVTVTVPPPNCANAVASPNKLWPPNHKFVPVQITGVSGASTVSVTSIFQDEPTDSLGDGNTCPDGNGIGTATANVRAERNALGNGRVYTISFTATNDGGSCEGSVTVCVPHSNNGSCGNGGALFNSGVCNASLESSSKASAHDHQRLEGLLCFSHWLSHDCDLFCDAGLPLCL